MRAFHSAIELESEVARSQLGQRDQPDSLFHNLQFDSSSASPQKKTGLVWTFPLEIFDPNLEKSKVK